MPFGASAFELGHHRGVKRWNRAENRWPRLLDHRSYAAGCRPVRKQHRCGAHGHWECYGVAETVGEEHLRGREDDILLLNAQDVAAVGVSCEFQASMDVLHALSGHLSSRTNKARMRIRPC